MPIILNTAFNPGDIDPGVQYNIVIVTKFEVDLKLRQINLTIERGYLVDDKVVLPSRTPSLVYTIKDDPLTDPPITYYTDLIATIGVSDVLVYDQVAASIYQWLIDDGHFVGTIV